MTIQIGDRLPEVTVYESAPSDADNAPAGPVAHNIYELARGKKVALFAVPGAFTPTCSAQHLPGFIERHDDFIAKGVVEIWCVAVNDVFVMAAWGRDQQAQGKVRMLADGSGELAQALGLTLDLSNRGLGVRSQRYSALIDDGVVRELNVEEGGQFERSDAQSLLEQL